MKQLRKTLSLLCALAMLLACLSIPALAEEAAFAGGSGTADDPWQIETVEQLAYLASTVNDGSKSGYMGASFVLTADLDMTGVEWTPIGNMNDMENHTTLFLGSFDGQGHTVSNLTYENDQFIVGAGLFGISVGEIKNVNMENAVVRCTNAGSMAVGSLVGYSMGSVTGCSVTNADVLGNNCTGGLIGGDVGPVTDCSATNVTVTVIGDNDFSEGLVQCDVAECGGLLIGGGFGGSVINCTAQGTVKAEGNEPVGMGGIGGCLEMMDVISNCTADVTIVSAQGGHAIGGLCGFAGTHSNGHVAEESEGVVTTNYPGIIENCIVNVKIDAPEATHVGGLVGTGLYYYGEETAFAVSSCTVNGEIVAVTPGALAGRAEGCTFENCTLNVTMNGEALPEIGATDRMYESADQ